MEHATKTAQSGQSQKFMGQRDGAATSRKRPWTAMDDTSSVTTSTSMSSESREKRDHQCKKCHEPEKPGRKLFKCEMCKYNYHLHCHKPNPDDKFVCFDCTKRIQGAPKTKNPKFCVTEGCEKIKKEGQLLCLLHFMGEKHRKASANTAPVQSRPHKAFDKGKIYRPNAETRKIMSEQRGRDQAQKRRKISNNYSPTTSDLSPKVKRLPARPPSMAYEARMNENKTSSEFGGLLPNLGGLKNAMSSTSNGFTSQNPALLLPSPLADNIVLSSSNSARASPAVDSPTYSPPPALDTPAYSPPPAIPAIPTKREYVKIDDSDDDSSVNSLRLDVMQDNQAGDEAPETKVPAATAEPAPQGDNETITAPTKLSALYPELIKLPPNATAVAHQITLLPEQRKLELRPGKTLKFDKQEANLEAALAYEKGTLAPSACDKCSRGHGHFAQCIVLPGFFFEECCSCKYNNMGASCSLRPDSNPGKSTLADNLSSTLISIPPKSSRRRMQDEVSDDDADSESGNSTDFTSNVNEGHTDRRAHLRRRIPASQPRRESLRTRQESPRPRQEPRLHQTQSESSTTQLAPKIFAMSKGKETSRTIRNATPEFLDSDEEPSDIDDMLAFIGPPLPYDSSTLDSYLAESNQSHEHKPTNDELNTTQRWGAIDPRVSWPKRLSADEYAEKEAEIKARGTRKQNFGKLLTPQVRMERAEKGWGVHQGREWPGEDDERERIRIMHLKELFGVTDLCHKAYVPAVTRKGLVMVEKGISRQRRKTFAVSAGQ